MDADRLKKLKALKEKGMSVFAERFERTHSLERAFSEKEGKKVVVAGRIMTMREMGKLAFVHLQDQSRKMQIVFELEHLGEEKFKLLRLFDIGDIIGVEGDIFKTKKGEISVLVKEYKMLSKALRPLLEQCIEFSRYANLPFDQSDHKSNKFLAYAIHSLYGHTPYIRRPNSIFLPL